MEEEEEKEEEELERDDEEDILDGLRVEGGAKGDRRV